MNWLLGIAVFGILFGAIGLFLGILMLVTWFDSDDYDP